jgi:radical SAM superfamily enzyme YgiQ (UPF0313 family)
MKLTRRLRNRINKDVKLAFCGTHALIYEPGFLDAHPEVDLVFIGEYEYTLKKTAVRMAQRKDLTRVPGLILRDHEGKSICTGQPELIKDIDSLPWPARHFLPMHKYFDNPGDIPEPSLQMWASRGCPFSCSFCIWPQLMNANTYRTRAVEKILDEMEHVCSEYGFRSVYFDDDTFNIGKKRMLHFCREKTRRKLDIPWAIMARVDLMDREILEAMAEAGLIAVKYGIESASSELLAHIGKDLNLDKAIENVAITKSLGIKVHLTFMFGIPGETVDTVNKSIQLALQMNPDSIQFSILTPMPGTRIYEEFKTKGHLLVTDWEKYDGYFSAVIRTDELSSKDLEQAVRRAWRSWFRHKFLHKLSWHDFPKMIRYLPGYLGNPKATINQIKRLFYA